MPKAGETTKTLRRDPQGLDTSLGPDLTRARISASGVPPQVSRSAKDETYNDIANWAYADLPKVFVESLMDPYDALAAVTHSSNKGADLDYGPRGPQHRDNLQLRPA